MFGMARGMIGDTSRVAIPDNAAHTEAAVVVADFLLEPATQARARDPDRGGKPTVIEPHPGWMTRIVAASERRHSR